MGSASLDAASVSDVVTKTVALSSDTQASCVTTTRRLQSSGTTTGTLAGTIDGTCSSFSTATDYITQTLTNIAGATSVSVRLRAVAPPRRRLLLMEEVGRGGRGSFSCC